MELNGVQIGAADPQQLAEFYRAAFGEPKWEMPGDWFGWDIGTGHLFFGPHSEVSGTAAEPQRVMIALTASDVPAAYEKLLSAGGREVAKPNQPDPDQEGFWLATVADPEGNFLQLSSPYSEM